MAIIGRGTNINGTPNISETEYAKVTIGNFCAIAGGLTILTLNHDSNYPAIQGKFYADYFNSGHPGELRNPPSKERTKGDVIIGNNVWIATGVFIGSGVEIGDGCIIAARSVVVKDLPPYTLCAGVPCVAKKKIYSDDKINFLLELKWWNWDDAKIKKNRTFFFTDINEISLENLKNMVI